MVDRRQLFSGALRGALSVGSFSRLQSWAAAKPNERTLTVSVKYVPTDDLPEARWKLSLSDVAWREPREFQGVAFETVVFEAVVSLGKGL